MRCGLLHVWGLTALLAAGGCSERQGPVDGLVDHTTAELTSRATFFDHAKQDHRLAAVKFTITAFGDDPRRAIRYYHSRFYRMHDEWYWFRLLNGSAIPGDDEAEPLEGLELLSIREVYSWAAVQPSLPLDLTLYETRLYSPRFYRLAIEIRPKVYGLGTLLHIAPDARHPDERWAFQLEYTDNVSHAELTVFFETLRATLPAEIGDRLQWLVRSADQERLAQQMEAGALAHGDRILRLSDLSEPGAIEVYNPGLTAGRVLLADDQSKLATADDDSIVVLGDVPDRLPAATALITAVPQTPLAHVNLLAQNRGIPNLYLGDGLMHPELQQLGAYYRWPAILLAERPDRLQLAQMSEAQFARYKQLSRRAPIAVPPVEVSSAPYVVDLAHHGLAEAEHLRPFVGGKSAGFLALMAVPGVTCPDRPLALTVRSYLEHLAPLQPLLAQLLATRAFDEQGGDVRLRRLLLEGRAAYDREYRADVDQAAADVFVAARPAGDPLGDLARAGGLRQAIVDRPVAPATLSLITRALQRHFDTLSPQQGLRFRSSSTVEDIEGFNGAGLYASHTGFIDPTVQSTAKDRDRTVDRALKQTWASYWSAAAFEERRRERIDHLSGAMAVLVHPRFDDAQELANGVLTLSLLPPGHPEGLAVMELNVQQGAVSVTNPDSSSADQPEIDRVVLRAGAAAAEVVRVRGSTLVGQDQVILSDEQLLSLFAQARAVTKAWLAEHNRDLPLAQRGRSLTLDLEFRWMAAGWPLRVAGQPQAPARLVLKQARSLEPGLRRITADVRALPIPRELLGRARRVERRVCGAERLVLSTIEVFTDPALSPDLGHAADPFTARVQIVLRPDRGLPANEKFELDHLAFETVSHPSPPSDSSYAIDVSVSPESAPPTAPTRIQFTSGQGYRIERGAGTLTGSAAGCQRELLHSSPSDYLLDLLARK